MRWNVSPRGEKDRGDLHEMDVRCVCNYRNKMNASAASRGDRIHAVGERRHREMSMEEFREWLKRFDVDKDGRISRRELREALGVHR
ncbi:hypothetical protein BHM03_00027449 [Ensete ventricosum]|nr:hypothetical protein BHM03_00027449 [Ensete ventricosum]